jgi:DNA polymerase III alpha subunit
MLLESPLPCNYDWDNEPLEIGKTGKPMKRKPLPKKCWAACRQFDPRPMPSDDDVIPYTEAEIRNIEMEMLGTYLSSSPFSILDPRDLAVLKTADDLQEIYDGTFLMAMVIVGWRDHMAKNGKLMKFLRVSTPSGDMDLTMFNDQCERYAEYVKIGQMALVEVKKNSRGATLRLMEPL